MGTLALAGLSPVGNNLIYPLADFSNVFQLDDNVSFTKGHHAFRFGGEFRRTQINGPFDLFVNGEYAYQDLSAFGVPSSTNNPSIENFLKGIPLVYVGVTPAGSNSDPRLPANFTRRLRAGRLERFEQAECEFGASV